MKVLSFNVRQWTRDTDSTSPYYWKDRMSAMEKMINDVQPDIICFQEMMIPAECYIPSQYKRVGITVSHPIYIRKGLKASEHKFQVHQECAVITDEYNNKLEIINVHSHWNENIIKKNLKQIESMIKDIPVVICGDFNNSLQSINNYGGIKYCTSARHALGIDESEYTFEHFVKEQKSTVDHFFISKIIPLKYQRISDGYGVKRMSDHYPILLEF